MALENPARMAFDFHAHHADGVAIFLHRPPETIHIPDPEMGAAAAALPIHDACFRMAVFLCELPRKKAGGRPIAWMCKWQERPPFF